MDVGKRTHKFIHRSFFVFCLSGLTYQTSNLIWDYMKYEVLSHHHQLDVTNYSSIVGNMCFFYGLVIKRKSEKMVGAKPWIRWTVGEMFQHANAASEFLDCNPEVTFHSYISPVKRTNLFCYQVINFERCFLSANNASSEMIFGSLGVSSLVPNVDTETFDLQEYQPPQIATVSGFHIEKQHLPAPYTDDCYDYGKYSRKTRVDDCYRILTNGQLNYGSVSSPGDEKIKNSFRGEHYNHTALNVCMDRYSRQECSIKSFFSRTKSASTKSSVKDFGTTPTLNVLEIMLVKDQAPSSRTDSKKSVDFNTMFSIALNLTGFWFGISCLALDPTKHFLKIRNDEEVNNVRRNRDQLFFRRHRVHSRHPNTLSLSRSQLQQISE